MSHAYSVVTVEKKLFFFISATLIPIRLKLFCVYNAYDSIDHLRGEQIEIFFLFRCLLLGAFFYPLNTEIRHSIQCMHFVYFSIRFLLDAQTDSFVHIARRLLVISSILLDFRIACSAMDVCQRIARLIIVITDVSVELWPLREPFIWVRIGSTIMWKRYLIIVFSNPFESCSLFVCCSCSYSEKKTLLTRSKWKKKSACLHVVFLSYIVIRNSGLNWIGWDWRKKSVHTRRTKTRFVNRLKYLKRSKDWLRFVPFGCL